MKDLDKEDVDLVHGGCSSEDDAKVCLDDADEVSFLS